MDFEADIAKLVTRLETKRITYALIGGLAMALRGVSRATFDLDLLLMLSDLPGTDAVLAEEGYRLVFKSENVSHYQKDGAALARVDILHAFRGPTLGMLGRAERMAFTPACVLPVLKIEDIIGLKIQALVNNPARALGDWNDIHRLVRHEAEAGRRIDWDLIGDYLEIFRLTDKLNELKTLYGTAHRS